MMLMGRHAEAILRDHRRPFLLFRFLERFGGLDPVLLDRLLDVLEIQP